MEIDFGGPQAHLLLKTGSLMGSDLVAQSFVQLSVENLQ